MLLAGAAIADSYQDLNTGIAARNRGDDAVAVAYLSSALAASDLPVELRPAALVARGAIYAKAGHLDAANADFTDAIKLRPNDIEALRERAALEAFQGHDADAIADYKQAVALQPDNLLLYGDLANFYFRTRDFAAAEAGYSDFIAKRPQDTSPLEARARTETAAGEFGAPAEQFDNAIADANASAAIFPKWADPHDILAEVYIIKGDFKSAQTAIDDAIDCDDTNTVYYLMRGYIEWLQGDMSAAGRAFNESLEKNAHQNYAFLWLNIALARQGKPVPADVAAQFSDATEARWPGPLVLLYTGRMQPDAVLKLTGNDPDSLGSKECLTHFMVGEWYVAQSKPADARPLLQSAAGDACAHNAMYARLAAADLARLPGMSP